MNENVLFSVSFKSKFTGILYNGLNNTRDVGATFNFSRIMRLKLKFTVTVIGKLLSVCAVKLRVKLLSDVSFKTDVFTERKAFKGSELSS